MAGGSYITSSEDNGETKTIYLGTFDEIKEAADVYDAKAIELRGEFAVLNNVYGKYKQSTEETIEFNDTYKPKEYHELLLEL